MDIQSGDGVTVKEALDMILEDIEENENVENPIRAVFLSPPDAAVLTDEDSGDEDECEADNLNARQLLSEAEVIRTHRKEEEFVWKENKERTWIEGQFETIVDDNFPVHVHDFTNKSSLDIFELFFNEEIINFLTNSSNEYAQFINCGNPGITSEEIKVFVAILILSGYNQLPGKRFYWDKNNDMGNELISNSMRRNRFEQILRFFHCCDNSNPNLGDKMWKLRPLVNMVKLNIKKHYIPERNLSYDECMVKYFGKHGCKQYIHGKPIRFGYKVWCLNTVDGYLVDFDIYQGKSISCNENYEKSFGKAAAPLLTMLDSLPNDKQLLPYHLYFDNLFTSLNLLRYLKERGYYATGTIRENRIPKNNILPSNKEFKKNDRGAYQSAICKEDAVIVVKWADNSIVSIASNCHGVEPLSTVKRYSRKHKKTVQVPRPYLLGEYNINMGGTDRMDENVAKYRIKIRNKKWYWPLLTWLIDICIHNAWTLQRKFGSSIPQLQFRREIVLTYLGKYGKAARGVGRSSSLKSSINQRVSEAVKSDGRDHFVGKIPNNKKWRCAGKNCKLIIRTMCKKCNIGLCIDCFKQFHTTQ